jgi:hypothetical protein
MFSRPAWPCLAVVRVAATPGRPLAQLCQRFCTRDPGLRSATLFAWNHSFTKRAAKTQEAIGRYCDTAWMPTRLGERTKVPDS